MPHVDAGASAPGAAAGSRSLVPRPVVFWTGVAICSAGVGGHIVDFVRAAPMDFHMAHMSMGAPMWAAMTAVIAGLVLAGYGLVPRATPPVPPEPPETPSPMPQTQRTRARVRLVAVLSFALVVDQMKPASLAFMLPGMRKEYGISVGEAAVLPTMALTGTVLGSLLWGYLADRLGRRPAVLLAGLLFAATTVCGTMPSFGANVFMCFLMGMSAGGMLPIVYALMSEVMPDRSGVLVLQAGLTTVGGYLAASGLAVVFVPLAGWRILWFLQLPFALALLAANRWIPESPGFLASRGQHAEARRMADRFGLTVTHEAPETGHKAGAGAFFGRDYLPQTLIICGYGLSWGTIYFGFMTFLPGVLEQAGLGTTASQVLFVSALLAIPGTAAAAWLFNRWSSKGTVALYGLVTAASLAALAVVPLRDSQVPVMLVLVGVLTGASGGAAVLAPYAAQVYPTALRGLGSGLSAACSKSGGMFGPPLVVSLLTVLPLGAVATVTAAPMALAAVAVAVRGRETAGSSGLTGPPIGDERRLTRAGSVGSPP